MFSNKNKSQIFILLLIFISFFARVYGQIMVAIYDIDWLPPMSQWYSGLIPYPYLLFCQLLIMCSMFLLLIDCMISYRALVVSQKIEKGILIFSYIYGSIMTLRYILTMAFIPEQRWFVGTIPIFMHLGLALFLYIWVQIKQNQRQI